MNLADPQNDKFSIHARINDAGVVHIDKMTQTTKGTSSLDFDASLQQIFTEFGPRASAFEITLSRDANVGDYELSQEPLLVDFNKALKRHDEDIAAAIAEHPLYKFFKDRGYTIAEMTDSTGVCCSYASVTLKFSKP